MLPVWLFCFHSLDGVLDCCLAPIACKVPDVLNLINFLDSSRIFPLPGHVDLRYVQHRFGDGWHAIVAHMNPTVVPITGMRDAVLGESSNIPGYGYAMCFGIAISGYHLGAMIFERKGSQGGGECMTGVMRLENITLEYPVPRQYRKEDVQTFRC